jgi:hypothetical protein
MFPRSSGILSSLLLLCFAAAHSAPSPAGSPADRLDQKRIHADYNEGNFEKVIASLEGFMASRKTYPLDDSVFIAKHLAVVYTANPATREKGKYYMYRLLAMLPSAKLVDMYVSDEIDRIFDKVREEFMARQKSFGVDTARVTVPARSPSRDSHDAALAQTPPPAQASGRSRPAAAEDRKPASGHKAVYLAAGGTALVALGIAAYFVFSDSPKTTERTYVVP